MRTRLALALSGCALAFSGCAYDLYDDPYGYGYGPYGGVSVGYYGGYGGYGGYPGYGGYGYDPYWYGYGGYDPFGWYGDYYYPGVGIYVYDRGRNRHVWNDMQHRFWSGRTSNWQSRSGTTITHENWSRFNRHEPSGGWRHHSD